MAKEYQVEDFTMEGRLIGFHLEEGYKIKYIKLVTLQGEVLIKLAKKLRFSLVYSLIPGDWLAIKGRKKIHGENGKIKLKADEINKLNSGPNLLNNQEIKHQSPRAEKTQQTTIFVCQKSDCCKRGAKAVYAMLQQEISDRSLDSTVNVEKAGCMKQCKAGVNIKVNKTPYKNVTPDDVNDILDQHFAPLPNVEIKKYELVGSR